MEGFLDLFLAAAPKQNSEKDDSSVGSSLHSSTTSKIIPAGAVASVVLWCDGELSKFASAFGGARILANLALSPPPRNAAKQPRVVDGHLDPSGNKERQVGTRRIVVYFFFGQCVSEIATLVFTKHFIFILFRMLLKLPPSVSTRLFRVPLRTLTL